MATVTTSTVTSLLKTVYVPGMISDIVFQNNYLFDGFGPAEDTGGPKISGIFPIAPPQGGTSQNWPVRTAVGAAEAFSEGQVAPSPASNTYTTATQSPAYFRIVLQITGHTLDAAKGDGEIVTIVEREVSDKVRSMRDLINTTMLGSSHLGTIVDSSTTYAGVNRSTYSGWQSSESAVSAALSASALEDMVEDLLDADRGASYEDLMILMPPNQVTNYLRLAGWSGNAVVQPTTLTGGAFDASFHRFQASFQGIPIISVPDMTTTEIYCIDRRSWEWYIHRPLKIEEKPAQDDSYLWHLTCGLMLRCFEPHRQAKLTGVTA